MTAKKKNVWSLARLVNAFALVVSALLFTRESKAFAQEPPASSPGFNQPLPISESPIMPLDRPDAFRAGRWTEGVHLLTGFGVNIESLNTEQSDRVFGLGSNFKADVGWYVSDRLAFEIGSAVKFNRSGDYLIWDTLFTLGLRYRFQSHLFKSDATFVRGFFGGSPTVIYLGDPKNPLRALGASRAQTNGPVVGAGIGAFFQTERGLNWFWEADGACQWLLTQDAIADQNDVPTVLQSRTPNGNPKIFSVALNIGLVLF